MVTKERIFVKGDVMTKYQKALQIRSEVRKTLKKKARPVVSNAPKSHNLPAYITDNPFYP